MLNNLNLTNQYINNIQSVLKNKNMNLQNHHEKKILLNNIEKLLEHELFYIKKCINDKIYFAENFKQINSFHKKINSVYKLFDNLDIQQILKNNKNEQIFVDLKNFLKQK